MAEFVRIFEVGPRDGLQNESRLIASQDKIHLVDMLSACGLSKIEVTSFVSPKWVPQMADAGEVMVGIARKPGISYAALTPNMKGYERARASGADEVAIFAAASETFSSKNINCSIAESYERFRPLLAAAQADAIPVRGYVSCVTHCPYEGAIAPAAVARVSEALLDMGCYEVSLGDTIGAATPETTDALLAAVLDVAPADKFAGHFHDTGGLALANITVALEHGLRVFDAAVGGLGGCPYAPGARGNVASESVLALLADKGFATGVDALRLAEAGRFIGALVGPREEEPQ